MSDTPKSFHPEAMCDGEGLDLPRGAIGKVLGMTPSETLLDSLPPVITHPADVGEEE
jgi:hypothetical protein